MAPPPSLSPSQRLQQRIPLVYRLVFLWIEPIAAFVGSVMALVTTDDYFQTMSPHATPLAASPHFQVVFDQLAATYFLFAFNEAFVLRATSEIRVWKAVVLGIICCDLIHIYATGNALGGLHTMASPWLWRWQDYVNVLMLYITTTLRVSFCLGIGIKGETALSKRTV